MAQNFASRLKHAIQENGPKLQAVSEQNAANRSGVSEGWSRKQELGHLIDSATNNRARFTVSALTGTYAGPTYDGRGWVELGGYADTPWADLVELWTRLNDALVRTIERIPDAHLSTQCKVGEGDPVTLEFLIEDYIMHMQHHLDHILDRERQTSYPSESRAAPL